MGLFNEARRTNAVIDSTIPASTNIVMDVNITDAGQVNGFDVKVNFTAPLSVVGSARSGAGCSAAQGCIFASSTINVVRNVTTPTYYWLAAAVQGPPVNGNGIMFRITFRTLAGTSGVGNSALRIHDSSTIQNPSSVPYQPIHGYFDNRAAGMVNYNLTVSTTPATSPTTVIIVRPVSGRFTDQHHWDSGVSEPESLRASREHHRIFQQQLLHAFVQSNTNYHN